jgi:riboflavin synthase
MFTGIIEKIGTIKKIETEGSNYHFTIASPISSELKIDQSVSHNGVCLTVVALDDESHTVTAIEETISRTNLGELKTGDVLNLERAMLPSSRLDGHIVQGHVDATGQCTNIKKKDGSWYFEFQYQVSPEHLLVDKGSVCINGVSLTVIKPSLDRFSVAIIPYTFENTNFGKLKIGDSINLEFDIIGKYIGRYFEIYADHLQQK